MKVADLPSAFAGDHLIVATAMLESSLLVTKDERIRQFAVVGHTQPPERPPIA